MLSKLFMNQQSYNYYFNNQISNNIQNLFNNQSYQLNNKILNQLNSFRKNPSNIIPYLSKRKHNYSLKQPKHILFSSYHSNKALTTSQGSIPINQLIGSLYSTDKMSPVLQNSFLSLIAKKIVQSLQDCKSLQQIKLSQSMAKNIRIQLDSCQQYNFVDKVTCLIGVGFDKQEYEPLISLLVDDGNKMRKNRILMMNRNDRFVGISTSLLRYKPQLRMCVYLFTTNITKK